MLKNREKEQTMLKRRLLTIDKPHVLVLHEHHGTRYLLVQNEQDLYRLALEILDWRFGGKEEKDNSGYYILESPEEPPAKNIVCDEEMIKVLPSEELKKFARKQRETYEEEIASYLRRKAEYDAVQEALLKKDGKRAWKILWALSNAGGEDDPINLEPLETEYFFE